MTESLSLVFEHDADEAGWCSLCKSVTSRGVLVRRADVTGGVKQADPSFDQETDSEHLAGHDFYYRIGVCCIGRMVTSLEEKK